MKSKKQKKYVIDEDITTSGLASSGFLKITSGLKDPTIIDELNASTEPVVFFTGNPKDFKNKLKKDHQLIGVSRNALPSDEFDNCIKEAAKFIEKKTSTRKHGYLHLSTTQNNELVLTGSPNSTKQQIFKILRIPKANKKIA